MASKRPLDDPLDETVFRDEGALLKYQGVHDNSVLFYFNASPFSNPQSSNAFYFHQAEMNPARHYTLATRPLFEAEISKMHGEEYIVAEQPAETGQGAGTGVWVIRKQDRQPQATKVQESFFLVGERIYQAPSVADVLGCSLLSITTSLNKFMTKASTFPEYSPTLGHTYPIPETTKPKFSDLSQRSKEPTPMPNTQNTTKSATTVTQTDDYLSNQLLADTINISLRYGDEYMDEVPVTGQPGEFHLSTKKQDKTKLAVPVAGKGPSIKVEPLPALKTDIPPPSSRKGNKPDKSPRIPGAPPKPKRRKSKGNLAGSAATSPTT